MPTTRGYLLPVAIKQSAASVAGVTVWTMLNVGNQQMLLRQICLNSTSNIASQWAIGRFRNATPAGGTAQTPVKSSALDPITTQVTSMFLDTGITMAGAVFDPPFNIFGANGQLLLNWPAFGTDGSRAPFIIAPQDGLCIRIATGATATVTDAANGTIEWDEYGKIA